MTPVNSVILTTKDRATLESMLQCDGGHSGPRAVALRRKLKDALVVPPEDIGADRVTLGSRVRFRVGEGPPEERTLVTSNADEIEGLTLLAWTWRGLALLGMRDGQRAQCLSLEGTPESIVVEEVLFQPEAYRREPMMEFAGRTGAAAAGQLLDDNVRHLTSYRRRRHGDVLFGPDSDDWGPGAA